MAGNRATQADSAVVETKGATYLELISKDEKQVQKENLVIRAQEAALEVAKTIIGLNSEIAVAKASLYKAQRSIPYSVAAEFKISKELEALETRLAFAQEIKETRFVDATL